MTIHDTGRRAGLYFLLMEFMDGPNLRQLLGERNVAPDEALAMVMIMAPEQILQPGDVDHRANVYSLGVVLYQMLTGELPDRVVVLPLYHHAAPNTREAARELLRG